MLEKYQDILAKVRGDGRYHSIRNLVQPQDAEVMAVAAILSGAPDFIVACQDFVDSFTTYKSEVGDFWATPAEAMAPVCPICYSRNVAVVDYEGEIYRCPCGWEGEPIRAGDCDDKSILLTSLLRYQLPPDEVYAAFGTHVLNGKKEGHMWVIVEESGEDRIVEATAPSSATLRGQYNLMAFFNDVEAYSYPEGIREFKLRPVEEALYAAA